MAILRLVVDRRAPLYDLLQLGRIEDFILACGTPHFFRQSQRRTTVTIGHALERIARFGIERKPSVFDAFRTFKQLLDRPRIERMEDKHARSRQERSVELEGRVFGGSADQNDRAVFHHRQKRVPAVRD